MNVGQRSLTPIVVHFPVGVQNMHSKYSPLKLRNYQFDTKVPFSAFNSK